MEEYDGSDEDLEHLLDGGGEEGESHYAEVSGDEAIEDNSHNHEETGGVGNDGSLAPPSEPKKTKKPVLNPQPKLNLETLQGPKGLLALNNLFKDHKFRGSGHEAQDLAGVLKKLEQWSFRLFPKFHFEDSLKRLEQLGKKREVQVYLRKIRNGIFDDDVVRQVDDDDEDNGADGGEFQPNLPDAFDDLLDEQVNRSTSAFDDLLSQHVAAASQNFGPASQNFGPSSQNFGPSSQNFGPASQNFGPASQSYGAASQSFTPTPPSLTAEQLARIEKNRQLALERQKRKLLTAAAPEVVNIEAGNGDSDVPENMNCQAEVLGSSTPMETDCSNDNANE